MDEPVPVEESSGNVFADLGLGLPEERLLKAGLGPQVRRLVAARGLPQAETDQFLGLAQPYIANLLTWKLAGFSVERLVGYLNALGEDVDIVPKSRARTHGLAHVTTMAQPLPILYTARWRRRGASEHDGYCRE